jgi:hypothetical protein
MTKRLVAMALVLGGLAAPAFAGETIAISYHQLGICKGYDTAAGPVTTRSDEAFAIFKIEAVDNTKPSGSFDFDPTHLYVDQSTPEQKAKKAVWDKNRRFVYSDPRFAQNMGVSSAVETTIPEGTKLEINGIAVVPLGINNPSGGPDANRYSFDFKRTFTDPVPKKREESFAKQGIDAFHGMARFWDRSRAARRSRRRGDGRSPRPTGPRAGRVRLPPARRYRCR